MKVFQIYQPKYMNVLKVTQYKESYKFKMRLTLLTVVNLKLLNLWRAR